MIEILKEEVKLQKGKNLKIVAFFDEDKKTILIITGDGRQHEDIANETKEVLNNKNLRLLGGMAVRIEDKKLVVNEGSSSIGYAILPSFPRGKDIRGFSWDDQQKLNLEVARFLCSLTGLPAFAERPGHFPECPFCGQREQNCQCQGCSLHRY